MKYKTQIRKWLMWHLHINNWHKYPKPMLIYPTTGWSDDPKEIEHALREDGIFNQTVNSKKSKAKETQL